MKNAEKVKKRPPAAQIFATQAAFINFGKKFFRSSVLAAVFAFFRLFLHFSEFSGPVEAGDGAAEVYGVAVGIFGRFADVRLFAEAAGEFAFEVFGDDVDKNAPEQKGNGDDRHNEREGVKILHGREDEAEGYERAGELSGVFGHFHEPKQGGAGLVHEVDAVADGGDKDGECQREGDQAQKHDAQRVADGEVVIDRVHRIQGVPAQKYAAENESRFFYLFSEAHRAIIIQKNFTFGKHFSSEKGTYLCKNNKIGAVFSFSAQNKKLRKKASLRNIFLRATKKIRKKRPCA